MVADEQMYRDALKNLEDKWVYAKRVAEQF